MFTGIIDHCGTIKTVVKENKSMQLTIMHQLGLLGLGESICVDGVCLTVTKATDECFECVLSPETLQLTTASTYVVGQSINLERAMQLSDRFGGHVVTGHVDGVVKVISIEQQGEFIAVQFSGVDSVHLGLLSVKGSITVNGVSLTINSVSDTGFSVMVIPHTLAITHLSDLKVSDSVNIEYDYLAKLIQRQISSMDVSTMHNARG